MQSSMNQIPRNHDQASGGQLYRRGVELLEAHVNDEMVALDAQKGTCYGFNVVATDVWRKLETPKTFDQLEAELLAQYEVLPAQCTEELRALLGDLEQRGLIEVLRTTEAN